MPHQILFYIMYYFSYAVFSFNPFFFNQLIELDFEFSA